MSFGLPESCGIAFKEWAGVRDALASGRQSIILRKGGIHEGPDGFRPEYSCFWIYPTHVHESEQKLKLDPVDLADHSPADTVAIGTLVRVEQVARIEALADLDAIADLHVWTTETTHKRFHYRHPGVWLLVVRVYDLPSPWAVEVRAEHAGCKTWVPLESSLPTHGLIPALDDREFADCLEQIRIALPEVRLAPPIVTEVG